VPSARTNGTVPVQTIDRSLQPTLNKRVVMSRQWAQRLVLAIAGLVSACAHVPPDRATIEGHRIYKVDGVLVRPAGGNGPFELKPGAHMFEVTARAAENLVLVTAYRSSGLRKLCLKARGGHRYQIRALLKDSDVDVFIVDMETGLPPKTPCGPDENDD
jgi:hypothetical protein